MVGIPDNAFFLARRWAAGKARTTLLASLLILALLLCHGAMGGFHQLTPHLADSAQASASGAAAPGYAPGHGEHASASLEAGPEGGRQAGHEEGRPAPHFPPPGSYLAALLMVFFALVFRPPSRAATLLPTLTSWTVRRPTPTAFLPVRPPTTSSLQVFRL